MSLALKPHQAGLDPLLLSALGLVIIYHGALLPYTVGNTYDAYIHMFFGDHYARSWFDPWEPRWYTGFNTTSYPPGSHMAIAVFSKILSLKAAFVVVMVMALCVMTLGVYRFSMLWVSQRAAGYAAIATVFSSSIVETVHVFGQLPTIFSLGLFLNGMPHVYRWVSGGNWGQLVAAVIFGAATTAAHHVTTLFGTFLFIGPMVIHGCMTFIIQNANWRQNRSLPRGVLYLAQPFLRGGLLGALLVGTIILIVFPYWYWSITDPITQVAIPHGSRESFIERPDLGLMFFVIPWGMTILLLPYVVLKSATTRLWPLGASVLLCALLGTGGTTRIPRMLLGGAFDILTLDRFTFWATISILPFLGLFIDSLLNGRLSHLLRTAFGPRLQTIFNAVTFGGFIAFATFIAALPVLRPTQPNPIDPRPLVKFMAEDEHDRWRYLTLGFGDQFAYISAQSTAQSVDGNYHSARRLPDLTHYAVERLENSKYLGVPGLGSLQQFLVNAETYHLKFVFSNDAFYDPLLHFSGWNRLNRLPNGIVVWEKPDITPLPAFVPRKTLPKVYRMMWGVLPPAAIILGYGTLLVLVVRRRAGAVSPEYRPVVEKNENEINVRRIQIYVRIAAAVATVLILSITGKLIKESLKPFSPEQVLEAHYGDLDFRKFTEAYQLVDDDLQSYDDFLFGIRWQGGLVASYAKLTGIKLNLIRETTSSRDYNVELTYLAAFGTYQQNIHRQLVFKKEVWKIVPIPLVGYTAPERIQRRADVAWNTTGRRKPIREDLHRDILDRPRINVLDARLVESEGTFSLVGLIRNDDVDPAATSLKSDLMDADGHTLSEQNVGMFNEHRLMPAEYSGFSIHHEGVLSLENANASGAYDPKSYVPPVFKTKPETALFSAKALVNTANLSLGIALTNVAVTPDGENWVVSGTATNQGTQQAEVIQLRYSLFGDDGRIIWSDAYYFEKDLKPGTSDAFHFTLPKRQALHLVKDLPGDLIVTNNVQSNAFDKRPDVTALPDYVPAPPASGYKGLTLGTSVMNYAPLF